ncbi:MAG: ribonuclease III [Bacteroidales bacterium]|jgi:ribonuclease-3|nr:ribonuclease III [Bacteroidales bacterium]MBR6930376.1 ribonuclease III [Bacteroidales bacterium]
MALFSLFSSPKDLADKDLYEYIHNIFGFYPKNITLYRVAFTHKSMAVETIGHYHVSNERMEYLGDSVLSTAVADYLFHTYPTQPEGFLTEMRSRIVSRVSLNKLSEKLGFGDYIRHTPDVGNNARSMGGNAFEALMGAIYLDRGFDFAKRIIIERIIKVHLDLEQLQSTDVNFKSKLLEWSQKKRKTLVFQQLEEIGEGHKKQFHVQIVIDGKPYADAFDRSIRGAEQLAAEKTCNMLLGED